ncbi:MAG: hypothetical protein ABIP89_00660, partial [Polyangiaceae bacterium]
YAFASHFAPDDLDAAVKLYRREFQPSEALKKPYVMLGLSVFAAESDREAERLFTSLQLAFVKLRRGDPGLLEPPIESMDGLWSSVEKAQLSRALACSVVGSPDTVCLGLDAFIARTNPDELIVTAQIFDHAARLRSFEILADVQAKLAPRPSPA